MTKYDALSIRNLWCRLRGQSAASQEAKVSTAVLKLREVLTEIDTLIASRQNLKDQLKTMSDNDDASNRLVRCF